MSSIRRNDPCPCGSGKKYKRCCLARHREAESRSRALTVAFEWLIEHHGEAIEELLLGTYFEILGDEGLERLAVLAPNLQDRAMVNAHEWVLAEGELVVDGEEVPVAALALEGLDGLGAEQRGWLEALAVHPLRPYRVVATGPGESFQAEDLLEPEAPRLRVMEPDAAKLEPGWVFGLRLLPEKDAFRPSPAFYAFTPEEVGGLLESFREVFPDHPPHPEEDREEAGRVLFEEWMLTLPGLVPVSPETAGQELPNPGPGAGRELPGVPFPSTPGRKSTADPEQATRLQEQLYREQYGDWGDTPNPTLDGQTPNQAMESAAGRRKVAELLEMVEEAERRRARDEGRPPASLDFLRQSVGLDKKR